MALRVAHLLLKMSSQINNTRFLQPADKNWYPV